jgi:hypothetical protein
LTTLLQQFQQNKRDEFTNRFSRLSPSGGLSPNFGKPVAPAPKTGPTPANLFVRESQKSQDEKPPVYDIITTDPGGPIEQFEPTPYPTVLPSLSAQQLGQLAERRNLADMRLKQAQAEAERRTGLLEAGAIRSRQSAERISKRALQDFMRESGGKGLARSPMVAGRQVRRSGEDLRLTYGEIDTRLSTEIAALQDLVSKAEDERQFTISSTKQEEVNMRTDLERLFPAASMFR